MTPRRKRGWGTLPLTQTIELPGDKSLSHRALIVGAHARGASTIRGINTGADVRATAACLAALGSNVDLDEDEHKAKVQGEGLSGLTEPEDILDAGNSGTTFRLLAGVCARIRGTSFLTGDRSLRARPMLRVAAPLRAMGAAVVGRAGGDLPPLAITGGELRAIRHEMPVASAQVKTCLLLAGLATSGRTTVVEPAPSRDHTERMLRAAGVELEIGDHAVSIEGPQEPAARDWTVPADPSAAMFFVVAALAVPGSDLTLENVLLNPTRVAAFDVLRAMGAALEVRQTREEGGEPVGEIRVQSSELHGIDVDPALVPSIIDEIPILTIAATQADGTTRFTGAGELRVKESDRIAAMATGLTTLGAAVDELPDGLEIKGRAELGAGEIHAHADHRVAMAFAIAALIARADVRIRGWSSVDTSFPGFIDALARARGLRR